MGVTIHILTIKTLREERFEEGQLPRPFGRGLFREEQERLVD
jgi:hypothetical protein